MTIRYFRALMLASIVVGIFGGCIDFIVPSLVPEGFQEAQEAQDAAFSTPRIIFLAGYGVVLLIFLLACTYGLYMLRAWAPRLSLVGTVMALPLTAAGGTYAYSGLAVAASYLSSYLWGAVLLVALLPPFSSHFRGQNG